MPGDDFGYAPKPPPVNHPFWSAGGNVNSQRFFIIDDNGTVEVEEDVAWNGPYTWVSVEIIDNCAIYLFEFSG